jgi:hypothetical protein
MWKYIFIGLAVIIIFLALWFLFSLAKELNDKNSKIHFYLGDNDQED